MPKLRSAAVVLGLGAALLAVLFLLLRPTPSPEGPAAAPSSPVTIELQVRQGRLSSGPATVRATQGDTLRFRITSDRRDHWHLHGYDQALKLEPDQTAELSLVADRTGRFEHELHHSHLTLGVLEVLPR